jgi:hypothetical protein
LTPFAAVPSYEPSGLMRIAAADAPLMARQSPVKLFTLAMGLSGPAKATAARLKTTRHTPSRNPSIALLSCGRTHALLLPP